MAHYKNIFLGILVLMLTACGGSFSKPIKTPVPAPIQPTVTPAIEANLAKADLVRGQQVWLDKQCVACHGDVGQGGIGGVLANTTLPFDQFLHTVRTALPPKPAYNAAELPDQDTYNIYGWLQASTQTAAEPAQAPQLPEGEVLGMSLWTEYECDQCHGSFAQGSSTAPPLAEISYPYEMERAKMRRTEADIPQHAAEHIRDVVLQRLYQWLQSGAKPQDGC